RKAHVVQKQKWLFATTVWTETFGRAEHSLLLRLRVGVLHEDGKELEGIPLLDRRAAKRGVNEVELAPAPIGLLAAFHHLVPQRRTFDHSGIEHVLAR